MKIRLDQLLVEKKICATRSQAAVHIKLGHIKVGDTLITKPGTLVSEDAEPQFTPAKIYVGRGALKLEGALDSFNITPQGFTCLDVGASTGGFTDCLLQHGAEKVYAVDVGTSQLHEKLKSDSRVINLENQDIRNLPALPEKVDLAVIDLSYISQKLILPSVIKHLSTNGHIITLFKPQFECGPKAVNKSGIIKTTKIAERALKNFVEYAEKEQNLQMKGEIASPITGKGGNKEYLLYFTL